MIALALDPGKSLGYAVSSRGGRLAPGQVGFGVTASGTELLEAKGDAKIPEAARHGRWFYNASLRVESLIDRYQVEAIVLERQPVIRGFGTLITLGLRGVVLSLAHARSLLVDEVPSSTWQAWARRNHGWAKDKGADGDRLDAEAILQWWLMVQLPKILEGDAE